MNSRDTSEEQQKRLKKARRKKHEEKSLSYSLKIPTEPRINVGSSLFSGGKLFDRSNRVRRERETKCETKAILRGKLHKLESKAVINKARQLRTKETIIDWQCLRNLSRRHRPTLLRDRKSEKSEEI